MRASVCVLVLLLAAAAPSLGQVTAPVPAPACGPGTAPTPAPLVSAAPSTPGPLGSCSLAPGDGTTCSANPCAFCVGKAAGVYPDAANNCTSYYDCYPNGAECLKCYSSAGSAGTTQCPTTCPAAAPTGPAYCEPIAPAASTTPASPGSCTVQPGDGSSCSQNPCTACSGKAPGVYADSGNSYKTYFDCATTSAECLQCYGTYGAGSQCPGAGSSPSPSPATTPASPAPTSPAPTSPSTSGCTQSPGDGSTCSQAPCTFCSGKSAGVYPDVGSACGQTYYSCFGSTGAECLKCYSSGYTSQCPAASACAA